MLMSSWAMSGAASQVRGIDGSLQRLVDQLVATGVWTGPDARRFEQEWNEQVHSPLLNAAGKMDAISFEVLEQG
ncbi:MAG: hypothetical protein ACOH1M_03810 [Rhodoglobus sp.]